MTFFMVEEKDINIFFIFTIGKLNYKTISYCDI